MQPQHAVARLAGAYPEIWRRSFPDLFRRAEWHIVRYLCTDGRQGASVGEVSGLVRQIFLLDDATVRERIQSLAKLDLCRLETSQSSLTARSFIAPTNLLLERFDQHLAELATRLAACVAIIDATEAVEVPAAIDAIQRDTMLRVIEAYCEPWRAAIDRVLAGGTLSQARRHEAKRHLISPSHWTLLLLAMRHHYEAAYTGSAGGLLADRMAAHLIELTGQNFQTTRDHLTYLMNLGVLERRSGKALHVALTTPAANAFHQALDETARQWPMLLRQMPQTATGQSPRGEDSAVEATLRLRPGTFIQPDSIDHRLRIIEPPTAQRHVSIGAIPVTIGRAAPADLLLEAADISRAHCRVERIDGQVCVTDLNSTNGTRVNGRSVTETTVLQPGDRLEIGAYVLEYHHHRPGQPEAAEPTLTRPGRQAGGPVGGQVVRGAGTTRRLGGNKTGNSG
jgi:hypothetical protein